jgi:hypothetical protein
MKKTLTQFKYLIGGFLGGPVVSSVLERWIIKNPSEWLVALIYILGFGIYGFMIYLNYKYKVRQFEFLSFMVHTQEKKEFPDGTVETKDYGRVDENSVKIVEGLE